MVSRIRVTILIALARKVLAVVGTCVMGSVGEGRSLRGAQALGRPEPPVMGAGGEVPPGSLVHVAVIVRRTGGPDVAIVATEIAPAGSSQGYPPHR